METGARSENQRSLYLYPRPSLISVLAVSLLVTTFGILIAARAAAFPVLPTPAPRMTPKPVTLYMPGSSYYYGNLATANVAAYTLGAFGQLTLAGVIGNNNPVGVAVDSNGKIYVANGNDSISVYAPGANADAAPLAQISGSKTGLFSQYGPQGIALDSAGRIYVTSGQSVLVFAPGSNGNVAPTGVITGANTGLCDPGSIAVAGAKLYVANLISGCAENKITVYPAPSSGNIRPVAAITGIGATAEGLAVDSKGDIYTTVDGEINELSPLKNNQTSPIASIVVPGTIDLRAIAVDGAGNLEVAASDPSHVAFSFNVGDSILFLPAGSNGTIAPSATLSGANTGLATPRGLAIDRQGNLYVANTGGGAGGVLGSVTVYTGGSAGNAVPVQTITGAETGIYVASGVAFDRGGNVYVASAESSGGGSGGVSVFPPGHYGAVAPSARIVGPSTELNYLEGVAVDGSGKIYALDQNPDVNSPEPLSVKSFAAGGTGDVAPLTNLAIHNGEGDNAIGFVPIGAMAVDAAGNVYVPCATGMWVYAAGSDGSASPSTVITNNGSVDFGSPLALDSQAGIYAAGAGKLEYFAPASIGNSTPARTIEGANTQLGVSSGLAVDASGNIYEVGYATPAYSYSLKVYRPGSSGNVAPKFVDTVTVGPNGWPKPFFAVSPPATP